jgi:uncharacterized protein YndB with AHSA1/START domain
MGKIDAGITVRGSSERAFAAFTERLGDWWPPEYTWSGPGALVAIGMEGGAGGLCYEIGPHGFRCDWGRILVWDPPRRLVFTWQIGPGREPIPDGSRAGEVEVRFRDIDGGNCHVALEHRGFAKYGPEADSYRAAMASPQGWPYLLESYRRNM